MQTSLRQISVLSECSHQAQDGRVRRKNLKVYAIPNKLAQAVGLCEFIWKLRKKLVYKPLRIVMMRTFLKYFWLIYYLHYLNYCTNK